MNEKHVPVVAGIGSCRIFTPLTLLGRAKVIRLAHERLPWYTHSTKDALQKVDIVNSKLKLSGEQIPLVVHGIEKFEPNAFRPGFYDDAEIFVIEIASIKLLNLRGLELQQWCIRDRILELGGDPNEISRLVLQPPDKRDVSHLPEALKDMASAAIAHVQSESDILADLNSIKKALNRPLILVPNINVEGSKGTLLPERVLISKVLEEFCQASGDLFFDPSIYVREYGIKEALKDLGHYTLIFEKALSKKLDEAIHARLSATQEQLQLQ